MRTISTILAAAAIAVAPVTVLFTAPVAHAKPQCDVSLSTDAFLRCLRGEGELYGPIQPPPPVPNWEPCPKPEPGHTNGNTLDCTN